MLTLLLVFSGCGRRVTPVEKANEEQILLKANGTDPATLDPQLATGLVEHNILIALFEGLMRPNPITLKPEPAAAEHYTVSHDQTVYTFRLRENARWSNGDAVTAADFHFAFRRILSPALGSEYAYMLHVIKNARAYNDGTLEDFSQVGVRVLDTHTLQIELGSPTPYFLDLVMHFSWFPLHAPTILAHGEMTDRNSKWTRAGSLVSNGPFTLKQWSISDVLEVEKSDYYWDAENVRLNGIRFYPYENINTEERAFRAGQVHITDSIPLSKIPVYREREDPVLRINPALGVYYYLLNNKLPPLDDPRVRKALSLAINRSLITEEILRGGQMPAYHFTPPDTGGYTARFRISEDPAEARRLLADAGFPGGEGFPKLELLYNTSESHKLIAEAIQQMWKQELGIEVELVNQDWKVYLQSRRERDYAIARAAWFGDFADPVNFLELLSSHSGNNHSDWSSEAFDALLAKAAETGDPEERLELFQEAEALAMREMAVIPIYFYMTAYLVDPAVQGWYPNILDWHPYQAVWLQTGDSR